MVCLRLKKPSVGKTALEIEKFVRRDDMKRYITISILLFFLAFTIIFITKRSFAQNYDDFIHTLTPKNGMEATENYSGQTRNRGLGGGQAVSEKPRATMHLQFGLNSDEITPSAAATLQELGRALQNESLRNFIYRLEGHTCDLGTDEHNMDLSKRRAIAVKQYLAKHFSLSPDQFELAWYGESRPAVLNTDETSRENNRRVVIENTLKSIDLANQGGPTDLQIKRLKGDTEEIVKDGDVLSQDDHYALEFKTSSDPYVYIFQVDAVGKLTQVFPNSQVSSQDNPVSPNAFYRIPENGKWLFLDENKGKEQLILLSQKSPISDVQTLATKANKGEISAPRVRGLGGIHRLTPPKEKGDSAVSNTVIADESTVFVLKRHFIHE
jgi:outer membrane protein OmpA-like peptidoglycan-associated protein